MSSPVVDHRSLRLPWLPRHDAPWYWKALAGALIALITILGIAASAMLGFQVGHEWSSVAANLRDGVAHFVAGFAFAVAIAACGALLHGALFLAPDLSVLLVLPITETGILVRRLRRHAWGALIVAALCLPLSVAYVVGAGLPPWFVLFVVAWAALGIALATAVGVLLALVRPALDAVLVVLWLAMLALMLMVFAATIFQVPVVQHFDGDPYRAAWRAWPGAWIADGLVASAERRWADAALDAAGLLAVTAAAGAAAALVAARLYRRERILAAQEAHFVRSEGRGADWLSRWQERRLARQDAAPPGVLARALLRHWSPRLRALLQFILRREAPERVEPLLRAWTIRLALALAVGKAWQIVADTHGESEVRRLGWGIAFVAAFAASFIDVHVPLALRQAQRERWLTVRPSLREVLARGFRGQRPGDRGDHRHPLVEIWPIGIAEFTRALARARALPTVAFLLFSLPFVALSGLASGVAAIVLAGLAVLTVQSSHAGALSHGFAYQAHPRRSRLRTLLRQLATIIAMLAGGLALVGVIVYVAVAVPGFPWTATWAAAGALLAFLVLAGPYLMQVRLFRRHRRRWFDAEYGVDAQVRSFDRW